MVGGEFTTSAEWVASSFATGAVTNVGVVESRDRYTSTVPSRNNLNPRFALEAILQY